MPLRRRIFRGAAVLAAVVLLVAAVALYTALTSSIPSPSGTLAVDGLAAPVEIVRDHEGVPHIAGTRAEDLYTALGFAHAQDRLWQMELMRRAAQGRLSEIFGDRTFEIDVFLRTLDLYGHAERSFSALPADSQALLETYALGVNAYLDRKTSLFEARLPPEFLLLRHTPEPWRPADSIVAIKMMALMLGTNLQHEIARLIYAARGLSSAEIADLMVIDEGSSDGPDKASPPPLPELATLYPLRRLAALPDPAPTAALDSLIGSGASNNWVVSGARTQSGKTLLANDPHLRLSAPSVWYLAHLVLAPPSGDTFNLVGATLPGTPLVVLGRSDDLAWGFTTTGADVQDIFIEKINPANPAEYLTPDGWRRFEISEMVIRIKGAPPRTVERRRTRHGPVLPASWRGLGGLLGDDHVAALQWTALSDDDTTIAAGLIDTRVHRVAEYMEKMRLYVVPMQSIVVADAGGRIGLIAPGRVPIRAPGNRVAGRAPVPGWDASYDWQGFVPFSELPRIENPPQGAIGTANARIVGPDYPHHLTFDWEAPYRKQRLGELVLERSGHDLATMRAAQLDVYSPAFARLKDLMIAAARPSVTTHAAILDRLSKWDGTMRADIPEPLVFVCWLMEAVKGTFRDDLGPAFNVFFDAEAPSMIRLLEGRATGRDWCDDRTTPNRESCGPVLASALATAMDRLIARFGPDWTQWRWGEAHYANGEHRALGHLPVLGRLLNIHVPSPGGPYTLNRGKMEFGEEPPFANRHGSSYRAIYDFSDLDRSLYIQSTGQSGHPLSPHYRSFVGRWSEGAYIRIPTRREEIDQVAIGTWRLTPP
jgi:penicillin amidase